jgi:hypothetical protein
MRRPRPAVVVLALIGACAVALLAVELGMGAIGFGEARVANPCTAKPNVSEGGIFGSVDAAVQRFALSGLNGAACSLHTSREELALSFAPSLKTKRVKWTKATIRTALRGGLDRAARDTFGGGILGDVVAFAARDLIADPVAYLLGEFSS